VTWKGDLPVIAVIADDLTGATDAGVQFARRGLDTRVLFDVCEPAVTADVDVLVIDTDSRALSPEAAYARVRNVAERLRAFHPERVYKKVDSTLRGNLGAEIDAIMDAFAYPQAVVAPAFPALGRTTRDGLHRLRGRAVHETEIGRDPKTPVRESHLVSLLQTQSRRTAALVTLETVERGPRAIRDQVEAHLRRGAALLVCDAENDTALRTIAASCVDRPDTLWVGSAGLADHLADALAPPTSTTRVADLDGPDGPVLLVAGSVSQTTRQQVEAVRALQRSVTVELNPAALADGHFEEEERCRRELGAALARGQDCSLVIIGQPLRVEMAPRIVDVLGRLAADCARSHRLRGFILTGGDTARAVCRHLGVAGIQLLAEIEPGVPLGRVVGRTSTPFLAVTKAGAFGSEQTLVHALHQLKGDS
jgi:D-threonate/D-erythronate kinase